MAQNMIGSDIFTERIQEFIDKQVAEDAAFAEKVRSTKRTVKDCATWMIEQLAQDFQKTGKMGYDDSEIYGLALHFFDEPNLKAKGNLNFQGLIMSNRPATRPYKPKELSDEEKARLDVAAREQYKNEQLRKMREAEQKQREKEEKRIARAKERQQQQAQQYVQPSLFDM
jgi:hypothetical protein